jgi:hypothetical protein
VAERNMAELRAMLDASRTKLAEARRPWWKRLDRSFGAAASSERRRRRV